MNVGELHYPQDVSPIQIQQKETVYAMKIMDTTKILIRFNLLLVSLHVILIGLIKQLILKMNVGLW
jgi:hypothetical protein